MHDSAVSRQIDPRFAFQYHQIYRFCLMPREPGSSIDLLHLGVSAGVIRVSAPLHCALPEVAAGTLISLAITPDHLLQFEGVQMLKYLLNGALLSAIAGIIPTLKKSQTSQSRATAILQWVVWGATVALAVVAIRENAQAMREEELEA